MVLYQGRFLISRSERGDTWAEGKGAEIVIVHGDASSPEGGKILTSIRHDQMERLAAWADPQTLSVSFTGLLAKQVRELAKGVGLTPQNFVLEAVNAFIQAGEMAAGGGHGHGSDTPSGPQPITLEGSH
ncbi:MAG: hypothetical protein O3B84_02540 [Chloroflexi bacterium]|nr:hypothetical protein [Chloroflexota bacterium]